MHADGREEDEVGDRYTAETGGRCAAGVRLGVSGVDSVVHVGKRGPEPVEQVDAAGAVGVAVSNVVQVAGHTGQLAVAGGIAVDVIVGAGAAVVVPVYVEVVAVVPVGVEVAVVVPVGVEGALAVAVGEQYRSPCQTWTDTAVPRLVPCHNWPCFLKEVDPVAALCHRLLASCLCPDVPGI